MALNATDEAHVPHIFHHVVVRLSQGPEGIDDDTENDIEEGNDHDQEEYQVVEQTNVVGNLGIVEIGVWRKEITYTTSRSQTVVNT